MTSSWQLSCFGLAHSPWSFPLVSSLHVFHAFSSEWHEDGSALCGRLLKERFKFKQWERQFNRKTMRKGQNLTSVIKVTHLGAEVEAMSQTLTVIYPHTTGLLNNFMLFTLPFMKERLPVGFLGRQDYCLDCHTWGALDKTLNLHRWRTSWRVGGQILLIDNDTTFIYIFWPIKVWNWYKEAGKSENLEAA